MIDFLLINILNISKDTALYSSLAFFITDIFKIFILMAVIIFIVSLIQNFLPPRKIKAILSTKNKYIGNILAAIFGIITPFCTCSAIPLFLGFLEAGVPLGATFSFLIASPMINEVAIALLGALFGWKIALIYIVSGLAIAIISGIIIGNLNMENLIEKIADSNDIEKKIVAKKMTLKIASKRALKHTKSIIKNVWLYVIFGVGVGSIMHGYIPTDFLVNYVGADKWYGVPTATIIGVPLYSNVAGIVPLVSVLTEKGVPIGTTLALMMSVTGLSLPEFMILKRIMKPKLIIIFASIVATGIVLTGYLFNLIIG